MVTKVLFHSTRASTSVFPGESGLSEGKGDGYNFPMVLQISNFSFLNYGTKEPRIYNQMALHSLVTCNAIPKLLVFYVLYIYLSRENCFFFFPSFIFEVLRFVSILLSKSSSNSSNFNFFFNCIHLFCILIFYMKVIECTEHISFT